MSFECAKDFSNKFVYIKDCLTKIKTLKNKNGSKNPLSNAYLKEFLDYNFNEFGEILKINQDKIERITVKCVFIGKTSNGKSAVLNGLLGTKMLPSSIGSTTSCFIIIRGYKENGGFIWDKKDRFDFTDTLNAYKFLNDKCKSFKQKSIPNEESVDSHDPIAKCDQLPKDVEWIECPGPDHEDEICKQSICYVESIELYYSIDHCGLLSNRIELIDCPGLDYDEDIDKCVYQYCRDADLFVLVLDCVSDVSETDKKFFQKVKEKTLNPNVIVLLNKWDQTEDMDSEEREEKKKSYENTISMIFAENTPQKREEFIEKSMYFVSAKKSLEKSDDPFKEFEKYLLKEFTENKFKAKAKPVINEIKEKIISDWNNLVRMTSPLEIKKIEDLYDKYFEDFEKEISKATDEFIPKMEEQLKEAIDKNTGLNEDFEKLLNKNFPDKLCSIFSKHIRRLKTDSTDMFVKHNGNRIDVNNIKTYFSNDFDLNDVEKDFCNQLMIRWEIATKYLKSAVKKDNFLDLIGNIFKDIYFYITGQPSTKEHKFSAGQSVFNEYCLNEKNESELIAKKKAEEKLNKSVEMFNKHLEDINEVATEFNIQRNECLDIIKKMEELV